MRPGRPASSPLGAALLAAAVLGCAPDAARAQDWAPGERLAYINCGRCHVIGPRNRMGGIGSTPGFAVIRTWEDWEAKMEGFYGLNPHRAFSQVEGITDPFPEHLPSPIHPIRLSQDDLDRIVDYARTVAPADLGAPIQ